MGGNGSTCCTGKEEGGTVHVITPLQPAEPIESQATASPGGSQLELTFRVEGGSETPVIFNSRPLGLDLMRQMPMKVKRAHAGGMAEALGIKEGWALIKINGVNLEGKTLSQAQVILKHAALALPGDDAKA
mmetsp:Transcript_32901/g.70581  ORF Transcript_32901/g.70581 Transcript_32901/m.70581 type:complete len:131 (+) Transcript_32901:326-718(+)